MVDPDGEVMSIRTAQCCIVYPSTRPDCKIGVANFENDMGQVTGIRVQFPAGSRYVWGAVPLSINWPRDEAD